MPENDQAYAAVAEKLFKRVIRAYLVLIDPSDSEELEVFLNARTNSKLCATRVYEEGFQDRFQRTYHDL